MGVIFAGAVQDMTILFFSMRRDGKSLGQMAREEIGPVGGVAALLAVFSIIDVHEDRDDRHARHRDRHHPAGAPERAGDEVRLVRRGPRLRRCPGTVREALRSVGWYLREVSGEAGYDKYVAHVRRHHADAAVMSRRDFERWRSDDREANPRARCC